MAPYDFSTVVHNPLSLSISELVNIIDVTYMIMLHYITEGIL